jgi:YggT family protein
MARFSECGHLRPCIRSVKDARRGAQAALFGTRRPATLRHPLSCERIPMRALLDVILVVLQLYVYLVIATAVLSWLIAFDIVNTRNHVVAMIADFLYRITEPVLRPIRSMMPSLGGIDISPIILLLIIFFIQRVIETYIYPNVY